MSDPINLARINIGVSVFGQEFRHVRRCLESCLDQELVDAQITVRLDGPEAAGPELVAWIEALAATNANLCLIKGQERLGAFASYHAIFGSNDCEYLCQVDADDYLPPRALLTASALLAQHPTASFLYTQCIEVDHFDTPLGLGHRAMVPFDYDKHLVAFMTFHLRLLRASYYEGVGGYSSDFKYAGDFDLSLRLAEVGDVVFLDQPLYFYRLHKSSASQQWLSSVNDEALLACQRALQRRKLDELYEASCDDEGGLHLIPRQSKSTAEMMSASGDRDFRTLTEYDAVHQNVFYISPVEAH